MAWPERVCIAAILLGDVADAGDSKRGIVAGVALTRYDAPQFAQEQRRTAMSLDALMDTFGRQEGLCEAGVFGLGKRGWRIVARRRFTNFGSAMEWSAAEVNAVRREARRKWNRMRTSVVAEDDPQTLEAVCAQCEQLRLAGDPAFVLLDDDN